MSKERSVSERRLQELRLITQAVRLVFDIVVKTVGIAISLLVVGAGVARVVSLG